MFFMKKTRINSLGLFRPIFVMRFFTGSFARSSVSMAKYLFTNSLGEVRISSRCEAPHPPGIEASRSGTPSTSGLENKN